MAEGRSGKRRQQKSLLGDGQGPVVEVVENVCSLDRRVQLGITRLKKQKPREARCLENEASLTLVPKKSSV